jgi:hypothetical protein
MNSDKVMILELAVIYVKSTIPDIFSRETEENHKTLQLE